MSVAKKKKFFSSLHTFTEFVSNFKCMFCLYEQTLLIFSLRTNFFQIVFFFLMFSFETIKYLRNQKTLKLFSLVTVVSEVLFRFFGRIFLEFSAEALSDELKSLKTSI